jgi:hypothetical protein
MSIKAISLYTHLGWWVSIKSYLLVNLSDSARYSGRGSRLHPDFEAIGLIAQVVFECSIKDGGIRNRRVKGYRQLA